MFVDETGDCFKIPNINTLSNYLTRTFKIISNKLIILEANFNPINTLVFRIFKLTAPFSSHWNTNIFYNNYNYIIQSAFCS